MFGTYFEMPLYLARDFGGMLRFERMKEKRKTAVLRTFYGLSWRNFDVLG